MINTHTEHTAKDAYRAQRARLDAEAYQRRQADANRARYAEYLAKRAAYDPAAHAELIMQKYGVEVDYLDGYALPRMLLEQAV